MKYIIDQEIIKQTTECLNYFSCLFGKKDCLCKVKENANGNGGMLFVEPVKEDACTYKMPIEFSWLCSCPTRIAIYEKYGM